MQICDCKDYAAHTLCITATGGTDLGTWKCPTCAANPPRAVPPPPPAAEEDSDVEILDSAPSYQVGRAAQGPGPFVRALKVEEEEDSRTHTPGQTRQGVPAAAAPTSPKEGATAAGGTMPPAGILPGDQAEPPRLARRPKGRPRRRLSPTPAAATAAADGSNAPPAARKMRKRYAAAAEQEGDDDAQEQEGAASPPALRRKRKQSAAAIAASITAGLFDEAGDDVQEEEEGAGAASVTRRKRKQSAAELFDAVGDDAQSWMRALGCSVRPNLLLLLSGLLPRPRSYPGTRSAVSPTPFSVPLTWLLLLLLCRMVAMLVAPVPTVAVDLEPTRGCCLQTGSGCWRLALPPTLAKLR